MGAKIKTQKIPEFPSHKNFQKALNDKTRKIETFYLVLNTQKKSYLYQATKKKI